MHDPIAIFLKEHDEALLHLEKLKRTAVEIKKIGLNNKLLKQLEGSLQFIEEEVMVHNLKEEKALFPVIEKFVEGPTISLKDDHAKMFKLYKKLIRSLKVLKELPNDLVSRTELFDASNEIVQLMVNHIHKENYILFPLVKKFLSKKELKEVFSKMI